MNSRRTARGALLGYGGLSWSSIVVALDGFSAVWGDVDGMHLGEQVPRRAPAYTHLWAWRDDVCARVRIDRPSSFGHIVGMLVLDGADPVPGLKPTATEQTDVDIWPVIGWGRHHRVDVSEQLGEPNLERLLPRGLRPMTFVRSTSRTP